MPQRNRPSCTTNFYPRPPRGGRRLAVVLLKQLGQISIHALREEGDAHPSDREQVSQISIHALREEGDLQPGISPCPATKFLSTPSARRATSAGRGADLGGLFLSTPSARRATMRGMFRLPFSSGLFLSTPSARRATPIREAVLLHRYISIHALREEGDASCRCSRLVNERFLSTPSARRATDHPGLFSRGVDISIHALREEGDECVGTPCRALQDFYPRPPRGGRHLVAMEGETDSKFLSTPSARRATAGAPLCGCSPMYFYPRPPRGGRPFRDRQVNGFDVISIHALREEGDGYADDSFISIEPFLSTPSARRATDGGRDRSQHREISIHALREEGDATSFPEQSDDCLFLSTPSARRATCMRQEQNSSICISIHALREEGDIASRAHGLAGHLFLSTPSARRATYAACCTPWHQSISIHALREEGDCGHPVCQRQQSISIHALREEGDSKNSSPSPGTVNFYPRPPRGGRLADLVGVVVVGVFLSTPSARRATQTVQPDVGAIQFLSTPSARRATSETTSFFVKLFDFYPRPPRGGRQQKQRQNLYFQTNYTTFCTNLEEP